MSTTKSTLRILKPSVPKRYLLFVAATVWTFAGSMLLYKGLSVILQNPEALWIKLSGCIVAGITFYVFLFSNISLKHTQRIVSLPNERPCLFSFFNLRSYLIMFSMITLGIGLRKLNIFIPEHLALFHVVMGIPLFMSSFRFYYFGIFYSKTKLKIT